MHDAWTLAIDAATLTALTALPWTEEIEFEVSTDEARNTALELLDQGYKPAKTHGQVQRGDEPLQSVGDETWDAMRDILRTA